MTSRTFDNADDLIRDLFRNHSKKELVEVIVAQTQAAVDAEDAIDVERLAEALAAAGWDAHPVTIVRFAGEVASEYSGRSVLKEGPS